jgi:hypothetical protein
VWCGVSRLVCVVWCGVWFKKLEKIQCKNPCKKIPEIFKEILAIYLQFE